MTGFIFADLRRHWAGALAVIILVALATALSVSVTLQERALRLGSARAADKFDLIIGAAASETQLVLSSVFLQPSPLPLVSGQVLHKLSQDERVKWAAPIGFGDNYQTYPIIGTTTAALSGLSPDLQQGRAFAKAGEAVIGAQVQINNSTSIVPIHGNAPEGANAGGHHHEEIRYTIVGRMKPTGSAWDRAILVPIGTVWQIHGLTQGMIPEQNGNSHEHTHVDADSAIDEHFSATTPDVPAILVKPRSIADAYKLRQDYRGNGTVAVFPAEVLTSLYATLGDAKTVLMLIAIGTQALIAAALIFVTLVHMTQRRKQIGALRALGVSRPVVFTLVWSETVLLLLVGILCGYALGYAGATILSGIMTRSSGILMPIEFDSEDLHFMLVLFAIAAVMGLIPGLRAYRQSPASALRS